MSLLSRHWQCTAYRITQPCINKCIGVKGWIRLFRPCPESVNSTDRQCTECPTFFHPLFIRSLSLPLPRRLFLSGFLFAAAAAAAIMGRLVVRPCFLHSQIIITEGGMRCERGSGEGRGGLEGGRSSLSFVKVSSAGREGGSCQWHLRIYLLN